MELLLSLLFLLLLPRSSRLYSLPNCSIDATDSQNIDCGGFKLSRVPSGIPKTAVFLDVGGNKIQSIQRSDFSDLTDLQRLWLEENQISHIEDATFSDLSSLTELLLHQNRLQNLTDHMFTGLSNLTVLYLYDNEITSISEFAFLPLKRLQKLNLAFNKLHRTSHIVGRVVFCLSLKSLDLYKNPLKSFESDKFPFPLNITELNLRQTPMNRFTLHSDVIPHLQTLNLSSIQTDFQWNVSDNAFLKSLRSLHLSRTSFSHETYRLILQSMDFLENLDLSGVGYLDRGLLDWACEIQTLQVLNVMSNHISVINDSRLLPCSDLTELDLSDNPMLDLAPSSLRVLTRLSRLYLAANFLSRVPLTIRNMSSLTFLSLNSNHINKLRCLDFSNLRLLTELDLCHNELIELNSCVFQDLQSLKILYIEQNLILRIDVGANLPNLMTIIAYRNNIVRLNKGVFRNMSNLVSLQFDSEKGTFVEEGAFEELTNLKTLQYSPSLINPTDLRNFSISYKDSDQQNIFSLPSLHELVLTAPYKLTYLWPQGYLRGLDKLSILTLDNCFQAAPDPDMFRDTPSLINLKFVNNEELTVVPELFQPLSALQTLDLSENQLKSLDFLSVANLTQLQTLILKSNALSVINVSVFEALPSLRYLDLSENPFACNCSNYDFITWAMTNRKVYVNRAFQYRCASPASHQGAFLLEFNFRWCWESVGFLGFTCSFAVVLLTLLSSFLHHFLHLRLHLLYGFYLLRASLYHRQKQRRGCEEVYDAFVSYSVHDEEWVYRALVPELEERQGWRLCLHHRDFEPGKAILENITDAIYSSRKTLCVISHQYLLSEWCSREIQMASFRLLDEQKDVLVLLLLEELSANQLSPFFRMRKLLRGRTYLSWSRARGHRGLFWERVRQALQSGTQLPANNPLPTDA